MLHESAISWLLTCACFLNVYFVISLWILPGRIVHLSGKVTRAIHDKTIFVHCLDCWIHKWFYNNVVMRSSNYLLRKLNFGVKRIVSSTQRGLI